MKTLLLLVLAVGVQLSAIGQIFNFPAQGPTTAQFLVVSNAFGTNGVTLSTTQTVAGPKNFSNAANVFVGDGSGLTGVGGGTNAPLLSGTNTWTGTNTFPTSLFIANAITYRTLWASPTNIYSALVSSNSAANMTNSGGYANGTQILRVTCPALLSTNSWLSFIGVIYRTNTNTTAGNVYVYAGSNTNYVGTGGGFLPATSGRSMWNLTSPILMNIGAFTNQVGGTLTVNPLLPSAICDTSAPFDIFIAATSDTAYSNLLYTSFAIVETIPASR